MLTLVLCYLAFSLGLYSLCLQTGPIALQDQQAVMGSLPALEGAEDTSEKQLVASPCTGKSKLQVLGCSVSRVHLLTLYIAEMMADNLDVYLRSCLSFYWVYWEHFVSGPPVQVLQKGAHKGFPVVCAGPGTTVSHIKVSLTWLRLNLKTLILLNSKENDNIIKH